MSAREIETRLARLEARHDIPEPRTPERGERYTDAGLKVFGELIDAAGPHEDDDPALFDKMLAMLAAMELDIATREDVEGTIDAARNCQIMIFPWLVPGVVFSEDYRRERKAAIAADSAKNRRHRPQVVKLLSGETNLRDL